MEQTHSLLQKIKMFLKLAAPVTITQFSLVAGSFVAVFLTGQYSTAALAGMAVGYNIWVACYFGLMGVLLGISPIIAQRIGADDTEDMPLIIYQGIYLGAIFSIILIIAGIIGLEPLLRFMNLAPDTMEMAIEYMKAIAFAIPGMLLMSTLRNTIDSHGFTQYTMVVMVLSFVVSAFFDYALILGHFGFPALGALGAGIATAIGVWFNVVGYGLIITFGKSFKDYRIFSKLRAFQWTHMREQLILGVPIGISIFAEISIFSLAGLMMSRFGTEIIAAHQAAISFTNLFYCFPLSISVASTIVVAYEIGAKRLQDAKTYAYVARCTAWIIAILICSYSFTHMQDIASLYTNDEHMVSLIQSFLAYAVFFTVLDSFGTPIQGILRGYRDVNSITIISIATYWGVAFPVAYIAIEYFQSGPYGVWAGLLSSIFVAAIAFTTRLWYIQYKKMPVPKDI